MRATVGVWSALVGVALSGWGSPALAQSAGVSPTPYDYAWLLAFAGKDTGDVLRDARFDGLLAAVAPNVEADSHATGALRAALKGHLSGPPEPVRVLDGRYAVITGCRALACGDKGLLWVDIQQRVSALALGVSGGSEITVASRSLRADALPPGFIAALRAWADRGGMRIERALFYGVSRTWEDIAGALR